MDSTRERQILLVGAVAGGLYLLYQAIQGLKAAGKIAVSSGAAVVKGVQFVAAPLGIGAGLVWKTWNWATSGDIIPSGSVVLPDGTKVPVSDLTSFVFNDALGVATFNYGRTAYVIAPNQDPAGVNYDSNGDYHAVSFDAYTASLGN